MQCSAQGPASRASAMPLMSAMTLLPLPPFPQTGTFMSGSSKSVQRFLQALIGRARRAWSPDQAPDPASVRLIYIVLVYADHGRYIEMPAQLDDPVFDLGAPATPAFGRQGPLRVQW